MLRKKVVEPAIIKVLRLFTGLVFIFSSFVKGVDPMGTYYRVGDYLDAYGCYALKEYSLYFALLLITAEFLLGIAFLFKMKMKLASLGMLLMMSFFTVVTYFDATENLVPDCGCFGDALKLTNWETFYKNIVLITCAIIVFIYREKTVRSMKGWLQLVIILVFVGLFDVFTMYNYYNLPVIDFRDWKIGNDMKSEGKETVKNYLKFRNIETNETKEYVSPDYPWQDSVWMSQWEFIDQRIDDSHLIQKHSLIIEDENGNDLTVDVIENPGYQLVFTSYDLDDVSEQSIIDAGKLYQKVQEEDIDFVMLTSSTDLIDKYRELYDINYDILLGDDVELEAMVRSNPGLVLLKNGVVIHKWHYRHFPDLTEIRELITE